ncbi:MAG: 16S rRNA (guanine(966)-N(2))-methyltransferase RsmD [Candidatus Zipacnadales bacterium]
MRVIAGEARSLRLVVPKGVNIRPTSDAVREMLFNSLADEVVGSRFLDVYAGTGAVGIEALSRGAAWCVFVERNRRCVEAIRTNLANTSMSERGMIVAGDARKVLAQVLQAYGPFDIVFLDPPYGDPHIGKLALIAQRKAGSAPGVVIVQHMRNTSFPVLPAPKWTRCLGETVLSMFLMDPPIED